MAEIKQDPAVAELNPNLYKAVLRSGLDAPSATQIQQMAWTQKKAKQLLRLSPEKAREEFLKLDPVVKSNIAYLYPGKEQFAPEANPNLFGKVVGGIAKGLTAGFKATFSPVMEAIDLSEKYTQAQGTPYTTKRQVEQGANFSKKLLSDQFNGLNSWNWEIVEQYEEKYGKAVTTLARAYAEGRNTGQALDLYGTVDAEILQAITFSRDNPKSFQQIKSSLKQDAQISPGRDLTNKIMAGSRDGDYWAGVFDRFLGGMAPYAGIDVSTPEGRRQAELVTGKTWMELERERKSKISGKIDAAYRILADPLTYIGIGAPMKAIAKGVGGVKVGVREAFSRFGGLKSKGQKLADQFLFVSENKGMEEGYAFLFKKPEVAKLWNEQLGPSIKSFKEAKTDTEKAMILRRMKNDFPEWYDTNIIRKFAKNNVFDAASAKDYFTTVDDTFAILNGNVDGISFTRNTIPYARRSRLLTSAVSRTAYNLFNRRTPIDEVAQAEVQRLDALEILTKVGQKEGELLNPQIEDIFKINDSIKGARKIAFELGRAATRSPGPILWGEDADKTANAIRSTLSMVLPKDTAEALTLTLLDEPQDVQLTVVRNAQYGFMKKLGLSDDDALNILNKTYNESSLATLGRTPITPEFAEVMNKGAVIYDNDIPYMVSRGGIHPSQLKGGIAPLPFDELYQLSTKGTLQKAGDANSKARGLLMTFNGLTRNSIVAKYNNFWSGYTLFPRLGMRTNVDESFFLALNQPTKMLMGWAKTKAGPEIAAQTALTGSSAGIGMYKGGFFAIANKLGVKINGKALDPRKVYTPEERQLAVAELQKAIEQKVGHPVPMSEISQMQIRDMFVARVEDLYKTKDLEGWENLKKIARHQDNFGNALIASMGARHTLASRISRDYLDEAISVDNFSLALKDMGLDKLKQYRPEQVSKLSQKEIAVIMWDNFPIRFGFNEQKIVPGRYLTPVSIFFKNNALKTPADLVAAKTELLEQAGVKYYAANKFVEVENAAVVKKFIEPYGNTVYFRQQGKSDAEIAEIIIDTMLVDSKIAFHGSETGYNQKLFDRIKTLHDNIIKIAPKTKMPQQGAWSRAVTSLTFEEFDTLTMGYRPVTGEINTRLVSQGQEIDLKNLENITSLPDWLEIVSPGQLMELMDKQVTGFLRQPALMAAMNKGFKDIKAFEKMMSDRHFKSIRESNPGISEQMARSMADNLAEKQAVEIVTNQAVNTILEYVDNPNIRSNFALSIRHLGRFYRATEDFHRRVFRTYTKNTLRSFYKLRLLSMGLQTSGSVYTDESGDDYIIFPTDIIISSAIEPVMRTLSGNDSFKVPRATDFAVKFRLINPSFAPDAGAPSLAGPLAAASIQVLKSFLRELPLTPYRDKLYPWTTKAADFLDRFAMGHIGQNTDLTDIIRTSLPMMGTSLLDLARPAEAGEESKTLILGSNRNKANLVIQAIAYKQAFGQGLSPNATPEERAQYIKELKIAANNIAFMQSFLGYFVSPGFPSLKESAKIPDYLKEVGIASPISDFWDIYQGILRNQENEDMTDAYDLAVATFVGKNPGKIIYTIPRSDKKMRVFINKTENLKNWANNNKPFIETYGETAFIFAPTIGEYNSDIYAWMEASGLVGRTKISDYLDAVQVAEDKQLYFSIRDAEKEQLKAAVDYQERKNIINQSERNRQLLLQSNPMLESALNSSEDRGMLNKRLADLNAAITSPNTPISKDVRALMQTASKEVSRLIDLANNPMAKNYSNFSSQKAALKEEILSVLGELATVSPEVKEASRLIFVPLLNEYSRDVTTASPRG